MGRREPEIPLHTVDTSDNQPQEPFQGWDDYRASEHRMRQIRALNKRERAAGPSGCLAWISGAVVVVAIGVGLVLLCARTPEDQERVKRELDTLLP